MKRSRLLAATAVLAEQQTAGAILALGGAIAATLRVLGWNGRRVLGVMTRVSVVGHTGRALELPRGAVWLSLLISVAARAQIGAAMT